MNGLNERITNYLRNHTGCKNTEVIITNTTTIEKYTKVIAVVKMDNTRFFEFIANEDTGDVTVKEYLISRVN